MSQVQTFSVAAHRNIAFNKGCKKEVPGHEGKWGKEQDMKGNEMKEKETKGKEYEMKWMERKQKGNERKWHDMKGCEGTGKELKEKERNWEEEEMKWKERKGHEWK